jgi:hypothetical protein
LNYTDFPKESKMTDFYYIFTFLLLPSIDCFSASVLTDGSVLNKSQVRLLQKSSDIHANAENLPLEGFGTITKAGVKRRIDIDAAEPSALQAPVTKKERRRIVPTLISGPTMPAPRKERRRIVPTLISGPTMPAPRKERRRIALTQVFTPVEAKGAFAAAMGTTIPHPTADAPTVLSSESESQPSDQSSSSYESEPEPSEYSPSSKSETESSEHSSSSKSYSDSEDSSYSDASYAIPKPKKRLYIPANPRGPVEPRPAIENFFNEYNYSKFMEISCALKNIQNTPPYTLR